LGIFSDLFLSSFSTSYFYFLPAKLPSAGLASPQTHAFNSIFNRLFFLFELHFRPFVSLYRHAFVLRCLSHERAAVGAFLDDLARRRVRRGGEARVLEKLRSPKWRRGERGGVKIERKSERWSQGAWDREEETYFDLGGAL